MFVQGRITIVDASSGRVRKRTYNVCAHGGLRGGTHTMS